jgi:hypothetical protein
MFYFKARRDYSYGAYIFNVSMTLRVNFLYVYHFKRTTHKGSLWISGILSCYKRKNLRFLSSYKGLCIIAASCFLYNGLINSEPAGSSINWSPGSRSVILNNEPVPDPILTILSKIPKISETEHYFNRTYPYFSKYFNFRKNV